MTHFLRSHHALVCSLIVLALCLMAVCWCLHRTLPRRWRKVWTRIEVCVWLFLTVALLLVLR